MLQSLEHWRTTLQTPEHVPRSHLILNSEFRISLSSTSQKSERGHSWNVNTAREIQILQPPWLSHASISFSLLLLFSICTYSCDLKVLSLVLVPFYTSPPRNSSSCLWVPQQFLFQLQHSSSIFHHCLDCMVAVADVGLFGWKAWKRIMEGLNETSNKLDLKKKKSDIPLEFLGPAEKKGSELVKHVLRQYSTCIQSSQESDSVRPTPHSTASFSSSHHPLTSQLCLPQTVH